MITKRFSDDELIEAIRKYHGRVTRAAQAVGCSAKTIHERRLESPEVDEAIRYGREELVDMAEEALEELLKAKDFRAINLVLRTLGRDRGYVERTEFSGITDEQLDQAIMKERALLKNSERRRDEDEEDLQPLSN